MNDLAPLDTNKDIETNGINELTNKFFNLINSMEGVLLNLNLSPKDIEKLLKLLQIIGPTIGSGGNYAALGTVSKALDASYKLKTAQDVITNLNILVAALPLIQNFDNDREVENRLLNINDKILDKANILLDEASKHKIEQTKSIIHGISRLKNTIGSFGEIKNFDNISNILDMLSNFNNNSITV